MDKDLYEAIQATTSGWKMTPKEERAYEIWLGSKVVQLWQQERCPYYRIYPGVFESLTNLDLDKLLDLETPKLPFGVTSLELEIPDCYLEELGIYSVVIADFDLYYGLQLQAPDGYSCNVINKKELREDLKKVNEVTRTFIKIIYGVLAIGDNPDIVKPAVLRADQRKFEATGDYKYVDKARRRGVFGFNIGEDIPTQAQLKQMVKDNELALEQGHKAPHIRSAHLALVWTGHGRAIPKIVLRKSSVINKELLTKIPQGFYEDR